MISLCLAPVPNRVANKRIVATVFLAEVLQDNVTLSAVNGSGSDVGSSFPFEVGEMVHQSKVGFSALASRFMVRKVPSMIFRQDFKLRPPT